MVHRRGVSTNLDSVTAAISHRTRRAIIDRLSRGPARISDVAQPFSMSLTGFCKHVRVLERAGLVRRTRRGRNNTLELAPQPLRDVAQWLLKYAQSCNSRLAPLHQFFTQQNQNAQEDQKES